MYSILNIVNYQNIYMKRKKERRERLIEKLGDGLNQVNGVSKSEHKLCSIKERMGYPALLL